MSFISQEATYFPSLNTVSLSPTSNISPILWLIKIRLFPAFVSFLIMENSVFTSCVASAEVGSSRMIMSGFLTRIFRISTICFCPTESRSTIVDGSILIPYSAIQSFSFFSCFFLSINPVFFCSLLRKTFSKIVSSLIRVSSWKTMAIPDSCASFGLPNSTFFPLRVIVPSSGL